MSTTYLNGVLIQGLNGLIRWKTPTNGTAGTSLAGYVSPNLQGLDFSHKGEIKRIPNQSGQQATLMITDEWIELTFDYIQQGTSTANALASAQLPPLGSKAEICGLPIFAIGGFADGLNTHLNSGSASAPAFGSENAGTAGNPWVYEGDAGGNGQAKENWNGKFTLRRYIAISSAATYTIV